MARMNLEASKRLLQLLAIMSHIHSKNEVLQTMFAECKCTINNRPITHVFDDPNDKISISPNDIFIRDSEKILTSPS